MLDQYTQKGQDIGLPQDIEREKAIQEAHHPLEHPNFDALQPRVQEVHICIS